MSYPSLMKMAVKTALLLLTVGGVQYVDAVQTRRVSANPIRRVVTMLQAMSKKVEEDGVKEKELFDQFMCYCKDGGSSLQKSIAEAETKIPQLESTIKETSAEKSQLEADIKQHKIDRDDAKNSVAEATQVREKAAKDYAAYKAEGTTNVAAMTTAIAALEKGMEGSFLQTTSAADLGRIVADDQQLSDSDRDTVTSFLAGTDKDSDEYSPQSGEITGILKQMKDTMEEDLVSAEKTETDSIAQYDDMMTAKKREIGALQTMVEEKTTRFGDVSVALENSNEDLADTTVSLAEDKKFLADLAASCDRKQAEWELRTKTRSEELIAISETIKILNDDDALELFKKTLPSSTAASFIQLQMTGKDVRRRAHKLLKRAAKASGDPRLGLLAMSVHGKQASFDKVLAMVDSMVVLLGKEQGDDDTKKSYCEKEFDTSEDQKKELDLMISDLDKVLENDKSALETVASEITAVAQGIRDLDAEVQTSTDLRKKENAAHMEELAANNAAKELLSMAKERLNQFYNPKLATAEEAPASFVQISAHSSDESEDQDAADPGKAPETFGKYEKKGQETGGVMAMIDMLVADLDKDITTAKTSEKDSQADYENFTKDSAEKRASDSKLLAEKEGVKAGLEATLNKNSLEKKDKVAEAAALASYVSSIHKECDWLLANFEVRKEARANEIESLKKAKAVLSGADYNA